MPMTENEKQNTDELSKFISRDFKVNENESLIPTGDFRTLEEFKIYLTQKVQSLLDNNYDILLNTLYRIDVPEDKLIKLFRDKKRENISGKIADLIIERSLQKVRLRQKYKTGEI